MQDEFCLRIMQHATYLAHVGPVVHISSKDWQNILNPHSLWLQRMFSMPQCCHAGANKIERSRITATDKEAQCGRTFIFFLSLSLSSFLLVQIWDVSSPLLYRTTYVHKLRFVPNCMGP